MIMFTKLFFTWVIVILINLGIINFFDIKKIAVLKAARGLYLSGVIVFPTWFAGLLLYYIWTL